MDDYISRQMAIDVLKEKVFSNLTDEFYGAMQVLDELPSAQPEIIYCKDCKWYGRANPRIFYRGMDCLKKRIDTIVPDRDFCSKAERRMNATD